MTADGVMAYLRARLCIDWLIQVMGVSSQLQRLLKVSCLLPAAMVVLICGEGWADH